MGNLMGIYGGLMESNGFYPLVSTYKKTWKITICSKVNPLFLWPFSIAMLNYQRVGELQLGLF